MKTITHTKHKTFFRNGTKLESIFLIVQNIMLSFSETTYSSYNCNLISCSTNSSTSLHMTSTFQIQTPTESMLDSTAGSVLRFSSPRHDTADQVSEDTDFWGNRHIPHTYTDAHEEQVLTAKDAWRWMLCYKKTVLFITVIPTVILLVTNQWTKIQAFTTGAGEFALWKVKRKSKQKLMRKLVFIFFTT